MNNVNSSKDKKIINTNEVIPDIVEEIAIDSHGRVDMISYDYNEYRIKLNQCYSNSTNDNSIISTFIVENYVCKHNILKKEENIVDKLLLTNSFVVNNNFYDNFLFPMIYDYIKNNTIINVEIENISDDKSNISIKTNKNDNLIILNINNEIVSQIKGKYLFEYISNIDDNIKEKGMSNFISIILTIVGTIITIMGVIIYLK